jgi:hypothetical protein
VSETLFSQIQRVFERTYAQVGINLEDCLIDRKRCAQLSALAGASARELSDLARTFLRRADDRLYVGIYYSGWLIEQLERHDPRAGLSDRNIRSLIMFVEEINHALHAALEFKNGRREIGTEDFARNPGEHSAFRRSIAAGYGFTFSRGNAPTHLPIRICGAATSRSPT